MGHICDPEFCPEHHDCDAACTCCCGDSMLNHAVWDNHSPTCAEAYYGVPQPARVLQSGHEPHPEPAQDR